MTADEPTHSESENSGVTPAVLTLSDDAQHLPDFLRAIKSETIDSLAVKARIQQSQLHDVLNELRARDFVNVLSRRWTVRMTATGCEDIATDGGRKPEDEPNAEIRTDHDATLTLPSVELTADEFLEATSNFRRRETIRQLAAVAAESDGDETPAIEARELAEAIAAEEDDIKTARVDADTRKSVYVTLQQFHLKTLKSLGIATVDDRNVVRPTSDIQAIASLLNLIETACEESNNR